MITTEHKALVRHAIEDAVNGQNLALIADLYAPDYVYHAPDAQDVAGQESFRQLLAEYFAAFPDLQLSIEDQLAEEDRVATRWTARGTHRGIFLGIEPTGRHVTLSGMHVSRIADGRIAEEWESFDSLHVLRQRGVAPEGV